MASRAKRKHFRDGVKRQMSNVNGVKYIKVPAIVVVRNTVHAPSEAVKDGDKEMTVSLRQVVIFALEHKLFAETAELRRIGDKIADWAETLVEGQVTPIAADWLGHLNKALETRAVIPYARWAVRQCRTLFEALEQPKDKAEDFDAPASGETP